MTQLLEQFFAHGKFDIGTVKGRPTTLFELSDMCFGEDVAACQRV